jgi:hypothetical protein
MFFLRQLFNLVKQESKSCIFNKAKPISLEPLTVCWMVTGACTIKLHGTNSCRNVIS